MQNKVQIDLNQWNSSQTESVAFFLEQLLTLYLVQELNVVNALL
jgi:hypothetical protein